MAGGGASTILTGDDAFGYQPPKKTPTPLAAYGSAVNTQGSDYDRLMAGYQGLASTTPTAPISYAPSADVTSALSTLQGFTQNGGYSDANINDIRARDISPIRSIYSNAAQDLARQKVISGGYSPGYAGATAKMARDEASQIGATTTSANAGIAEQVQAGKLAALSPYASLAGSQSNNQLSVANTNASIDQANKQRQLSILQGQQSLYGTNPALVNTFGNQALETANLNQNNNQFNTRTAQANNLAKLTAAGRL